LRRLRWVAPIVLTALAGGIAVLRWQLPERASLATAERRAPAGEAPPGAPKAVVDKTMHDFGIFDPRESCEHTFSVRNEGDAPLQLLRGSTSCKCTMSDLPDRLIAPQAGAEIRIASKIRQESGAFKHTANIITNDPENPKIELSIRGTIRRYVAAMPERIVLAGVARNESRVVSVAVYSQVWRAFEIDQIASSLEGVSWEIEPAPADALAALQARSGYRLAITLPSGLPSGTLWERLEMRVTPDDPAADCRPFQIELAGTVLSRISMHGPRFDSRKVLRLGAVRQGQGARERLTVKVRDDHRRLKLQAVESEPEFLRVEFSPLAEHSEELGLYRVDVEVPPDAPPSNHLAEMGTVRIRTDHPIVPELEFQVAFAVMSR